MKEIEINADRCMGCMTCCNVCSFTHEGEFNPGRAQAEDLHGTFHRGGGRPGSRIV